MDGVENFIDLFDSEISVAALPDLTAVENSFLDVTDSLLFNDISTVQQKISNKSRKISSPMQRISDLENDGESEDSDNDHKNENYTNSFVGSKFLACELDDEDLNNVFDASKSRYTSDSSQSNIFTERSHNLKRKSINDNKNFVNLRQSNDYFNELDCSYSRSMSKNAIAARENRQKKKNYIAGMEKTIKSLSTENDQLRKKVGGLQKELSFMKQNIAYLQNVILNDSALSRLLRNIPNTPDIRFVSPTDLVSSVSESSDVLEDVCSSKRKCMEEIGKNSESKRQNALVNQSEQYMVSKIKDHDYGSAGGSNIKRKVDKTVAGVCLHVNNSMVSIEMCEYCNRQAAV